MSASDSRGYRWFSALFFVAIVLLPLGGALSGALSPLTAGIVFGSGTLAYLLFVRYVSQAVYAVWIGISTDAVGTLLGLIATVGQGVSEKLSRSRPRQDPYERTDVLNHDTRAELYETIVDRPGLHLSGLSDETDTPLSTLRHHVRELEEEDVVFSTKIRGKRRYYPARVEGVELAAALEDEPTGAVLDALGRIGPATVSELADELDRDPSTVSHHLSRLADEGLVERERVNQSVLNDLSPTVKDVMTPGPEGQPTPGRAG